MNRRKALLIILLITITLLVVFSIFINKFFTAFGKAFGEDCKIVETYYVNNYKIEKLECIGWAGPKYYPYKLYENNKLLSAGLLKTDTCEFYFGQGNDTMLLLNQCKQTIEVFQPEKIYLYQEEIDSVIVKKAGFSIVKKLNQTEVSDFITRWNNAISDGAQSPDKEWYPMPKYVVEVFTKKGVRKFKTSHITIQENESFWEFNILDKGEKRTTQKFDQVFNIKD